MLAWKKTLYRFLGIYILSTISLVAIGGYFYYQLSYKSIIEKDIFKLQRKVYQFIEKNHEKHFFQTRKNLDFNGIKIAIFHNEKLLISNYILENKIEFDKLYWLKNNKLYYNFFTRKKWGKFNFVTYKNISKEIESLQKSMTLFLIFVIIFIIFISYILGNIFLKPMKETFNMIEEFIQDTTHEINTPISNIVANIELLKELFPEIKDSEELKKIDRSCFRISKIFNDLSYISLNHNYYKKLNYTRIDKILLDRILFFETIFKTKELKIKKEIEKTIVYMDEEDLVRIIDNLLSNLAKYSPKKDKIEIVLKNNRLKLINSGNLSSPKTLLNKFVRGSKVEGGFGLGLHIVEEITKKYGFKFKFYSKSKKVYSEVIFISSSQKFGS